MPRKMQPLGTIEHPPLDKTEQKEFDLNSGNTKVEFPDGGFCYKTPSGGRIGVFPESGIEFELKKRTLGVASRIERAMNGEGQKYPTEMILRLFCALCIRWGNTSNCVMSQLEELDELTDGRYMANVMMSFQPDAFS